MTEHKMTPTPTIERSSILQKSVQVLTIISQARHPLRLKEITELSGHKRSTVHRLLSVLQVERLIQFDRESKCYSIGAKLFELADHGVESADLRKTAMQDLVKLQRATGFNVAMGELKGMDVIGLCFLEGEGQWNRHHRPGMGEPAYCSATGKVLLAFLDPERLSARLHNLNIRPLTKQTIKTREELEVVLVKARRDCFAVNDREEYDHIIGIAAPIFNHREEATAAISVFTVTDIASMSELQENIDLVKATADQITERISGRLGFRF